MASGHCHAACINRASATDVVQRVANDDDFAMACPIRGCLQKIAIEMKLRRSQRRRRDVAALFVFVAESTERKPVPKIEMQKFAACSLANVARNKANGDVVPGSERI